MKQTGQLKIIKSGASVNFEHQVTFIFTKQDKTNFTRSTNAKGAWNFDVPNGEYFISAFVTNSTEKKTEQFRGGLLFVVNAQTKVTALDDWIGGGQVDAKDPNKDWWESLLKETQNAATEAKQIQQQMQNNSVGDADGKWLKEGASKSDFLKTFGKYYSQDPMPRLMAGDTGLSYAKHFKTNNMGLDFANTGIGETEFLYYEVQINYAAIDAAVIEFKGYRGRAIYAQAYKRVDGTWTKPVVFYNQENTKIDKNNVLHATTGTPKDTLLVGDSGFSVVNPSITTSQMLSNPDALVSSFSGDIQTSSNHVAFGGSKAGIILKRGGNLTQAFYVTLGEQVGITTYFHNAYRSHCEFWTTKNTIVDTNGNVKRASPTVELFNNHINFTGFGDQVPIFEKLATGTYKISNTHGMAREGWTYQKPQGKDGNYFFKIRVQKLEDGCIVTVHDYYTADEEIEIIDEHGKPRKVKKQVEVLGMPRDIKPNERWINLRFHEQIYSLTNELPEINVPYRELWGIEPYIPPIVEPIEEDIALEDQRAF